MRELSIVEAQHVGGASFLGVVTYGTVGFWVGGFTGFCMGFLPAIPGALIGLALGMYMGTDSDPQVIIIKEYVDNNKELEKMYGGYFPGYFNGN